MDVTSTDAAFRHRRVGRGMAAIAATTLVVIAYALATCTDDHPPDRGRRVMGPCAVAPSAGVDDTPGVATIR